MYDFLDTDSNKKLQPKDVRSIFSLLDTDLSKYITRKEFNSRLNPGIQSLCKTYCKEAFTNPALWDPKRKELIDEYNRDY